MIIVLSEGQGSGGDKYSSLHPSKLDIGGGSNEILSSSKSVRGMK